MRTTFPEVEGNPVQVIAPTLRLTLPVVDLQDLPKEEQKTARTLLKLPLKEQRTPSHETESTIESLKQWLAGKTDILVE